MEDPDVYISFTQIDKIGINPQSKYNTPVGIYCYPLTQFCEWYINTSFDMTKPVGYYAPFAGSSAYINFIRCKDKAHFINDMYKDYGSDKFDRDIGILEKKYENSLNEKIVGKIIYYVFFELEDILEGPLLGYGDSNEERVYTLVKNAINANLDPISLIANKKTGILEKVLESKMEELEKCLIDKQDKIYFSFVIEDILNEISYSKGLFSSWISQAKEKNPVMSMWNVTRLLASDLSANGKQASTKWNLILSKDLGYSGFADKSGRGYIHNSEPMQAVFLNTGSFEVIARMKNVPDKVSISFNPKDLILQYKSQTSAINCLRMILKKDTLAYNNTNYQCFMFDKISSKDSEFIMTIYFKSLAKHASDLVMGPEWSINKIYLDNAYKMISKIVVDKDVVEILDQEILNNWDELSKKYNITVK